MRDANGTMDIDDALNSSRHSSRTTKKRGEGEVVASLRALSDSIDDEVMEKILDHERVRSTLSSLNKTDGLEAVKKFGDSLENRPPELEPIEDHAGYFLRILGRYNSSQKSSQNNKREGEVVASLRRLGRKRCVGNDMVEDILSNEEVRASLSSLTKSQGLEAVEKLGNSMTNRPKDLDPIKDSAGYFARIISRYTEGDNAVFSNPYHNRNSNSNSKKRQRAGSLDRNSKHGDEDEGSLSEAEGESLHSQLRLANRRVGRFKVNYYKSEKMVSKLEVQVQNLTSELKKTKKELAEHKNKD
mmetsp:Transcript_4214/g.4619  ORF Transcript_4214/g.4619 Transcript_4214/m.4619 type:complete len:300 (+) Transcript_4214:145-1044(+)|eukprot:CAMPEP_0194131968 /NCGR_PEP_ID=MMETSP0152-20130528/2564_1 /TAXON_ID=1049557 /ORGANISM="Thalassiothrix antarctica, Strain L6-D1" /LENGTH=299 /DNA_ID=CAMNT_0038826869 /DNA_START=82 /DNA_END=981 /DNA_ORIENTATION=+